jgi:hypothetical protein
VIVVVVERIAFGAVVVMHCFGAVTVVDFVPPDTVVVIRTVLGCTILEQALVIALQTKGVTLGGRPLIVQALRGVDDVATPPRANNSIFAWPVGSPRALRNKVVVVTL